MRTFKIGTLHTIEHLKRDVDEKMQLTMFQKYLYWELFDYPNKLKMQTIYL
jgi:hypothetical protein